MSEPIDLEAIKRDHDVACDYHQLRMTISHRQRGQLIAEVERLRARVEELEPESDAWRRVYAALHDVRIGGLSAIESAEAVIKGTHEEVLALRRRVAELERDAARLDWLDRMNSGLNRYYGTDYGWRLILSPNVTRLMAGRHDNGFVGDIDLHDSEGSNARCRSCRDAIDEAMSEGEQ